MQLRVTGSAATCDIDSEKSGRRFPATSLSLLLLSCLLGSACGGGSSSPQVTTPNTPAPALCGAASNSAARPAASRHLSSTPAAQDAIPATYFSFNLHPEVFIGQIPWPTIPFGAVRLWATETTWNDINTSSGVYDFSTLDNTIAVAQQNKQTDFIYTFGVVPPWASSNPNDQSCVTQNSPAGSCDPPADLNADGSGPDLYWQTFVTAITTHNASLNFPIHTWEIWNEPNILTEWNGTPAQMARMAQDAYNIIQAAHDPFGANVTTPTPGNDGTGQNINSWEPAYLAALSALSPGNTYADIVTFHGYADATHGTLPEAEVSNVSDLTAAIAQTPFASLPIWNTEGSWNLDTGLPDPDMQAAYTARLYLIQWSLGVSRFYWFQYGNQQNGTLLTSSGSLDPAGVAYGQVNNWMVGATQTSPCSASGTIWTCGFTNGSVQEQAVWDASQSCSNGVCPTSSYTPSPTYSQCSDLAGNKNSINAGAPIGIGAEPVLLETQ